MTRQAKQVPGGGERKGTKRGQLGWHLPPRNTPDFSPTDYLYNFFTYEFPFFRNWNPVTLNRDDKRTSSQPDCSRCICPGCSVRSNQYSVVLHKVRTGGTTLSRPKAGGHMVMESLWRSRCGRSFSSPQHPQHRRVRRHSRCSPYHLAALLSAHVHGPGAWSWGCYRYHRDAVRRLFIFVE